MGSFVKIRAWALVFDEIGENYKAFEEADGDEEPENQLQKRGKRFDEFYNGINKTVADGVHDR